MNYLTRNNCYTNSPLVFLGENVLDFISNEGKNLFLKIQ